MPRAEHIIVDTMQPMKRFLKDSHFFASAAEISQDYMEDYLDNVIDRVLDCVSHESQIHSRLWDYANQLKDYGNFRNETEEAMRMAQCVVEFGESLAERLKAIGAYNNRQLGYYYSGRIAHADLILTRMV